jgi:glycosyltransferase involved in cell wall biosynthesis
MLESHLMKIALVYDRVNKWGGAERVLLALNELFPDAPLFTSVYSPVGAPWAKVFPKVVSSYLQKFPITREHHEKLALFMPHAFESLDLKDFDTVISVTSEAAKGIITGPHQKHICYCLTPTRYLWSGYDDYFPTTFHKTVARPATQYLRTWDRVAGNRPDKMIAISTAVQKRIKKYYGRDSEIVFPPVTLVSSSDKQVTRKKDFFLVVSRLVPYKKVDLAIKAFNQLKLPLLVVGTGSEERSLQELAHRNIRFLKNVSDQELSKLYRQAQALVFPQDEDFGLVAAEAQAHGLPIIAYKSGGALDIIQENINGLFFRNQTVECLSELLAHFTI